MQEQQRRDEEWIGKVGDEAEERLDESKEDEDRTTEDKKSWSNSNTSDEWKESNLEIIRSRLSNWQLEAWEKSYAHKKRTGNSLLKEKILKQKK